MNLVASEEYKSWIVELKKQVKSSQIKAAITVNAALIEFYFKLGKNISDKENIWGSKLIHQISKDLKSEFPEMKGFSERNLKYCRFFYNFYSSSIGQQAVAQNIPDILYKVPWGHHIQIFTKAKDLEEALFYLNQTIDNNWGRESLALQIKSNLFIRIGKSLTNFKNTLPEPQSDLAQQTLKDPYNFEFLSITKPYVERDIENQLVHHIRKFLLELGKGFAFVGQQYELKVGEKDYYIDLLFYHTRLKCYVVIELKNTSFIPEYTGKLNFYLSAVDTLLKLDDDNATIGILLCRDKNNVEAEFALRDIGKPIGISEFSLTETLPENLKSSLPTVEEIERELFLFEFED